MNQQFVFFFFIMWKTVDKTADDVKTSFSEMWHKKVGKDGILK